MRFDSYHPAINFIYFTAVMTFTLWFDHPVFLAISYSAAFFYALKLRGLRALALNLCLILAALAYGAFYAYYNHFGITILGQNIIDNQITLEALIYGLIRGFTAAAAIMWISCLLVIFTADKVVYLFGRVSPRLSLFLSILLRTGPRLKSQARRIHRARRGVGRGLGQGNIWRRSVNLWRLCSILITWTLESFLESATSMKSRGYSLKGRTAFSIYRFDNRDRSFVVAVFFCLTLIFMAAALDQTWIYYDPEIVMNRITPLSYVFYLAYAALLLLPLGLQLAGERKFAGARRAVLQQSFF